MASVETEEALKAGQAVDPLSDTQVAIRIDVAFRASVVVLMAGPNYEAKVLLEANLKASIAVKSDCRVGPEPPREESGPIARE